MHAFYNFEADLLLQIITQYCFNHKPQLLPIHKYDCIRDAYVCCIFYGMMLSHWSTADHRIEFICITLSLYSYSAVFIQYSNVLYTKFDFDIRVWRENKIASLRAGEKCVLNLLNY